jgi:hypothetical protein
MRARGVLAVGCPVRVRRSALALAGRHPMHRPLGPCVRVAAYVFGFGVMFVRGFGDDGLGRHRQTRASQSVDPHASEQRQQDARNRGPAPTQARENAHRVAHRFLGEEGCSSRLLKKALVDAMQGAPPEPFSTAC